MKGKGNANRYHNLRLLLTVYPDQGTGIKHWRLRAQIAGPGDGDGMGKRFKLARLEPRWRSPCLQITRFIGHEKVVKERERDREAAPWLQVKRS